MNSLQYLFQNTIVFEQHMLHQELLSETQTIPCLSYAFWHVTWFTAFAGKATTPAPPTYMKTLNKEL